MQVSDCYERSEVSEARAVRWLRNTKLRMRFCVDTSSLLPDDEMSKQFFQNVVLRSDLTF